MDTSPATSTPASPHTFAGDPLPTQRRPYVGAAVHWVYAGWFPDKLVGKPTAAVVVRVSDAERGRVDLQAFKLDCHGCILMRDVEYDGDGAPGTWHWRGE